MSKIQIMDVTLRDGSYALNFQFTANDTIAIAKALENAGVMLIEIGHGEGLGASRVVVTLLTDELFAGCCPTLTKKFGVLFPGIVIGSIVWLTWYGIYSNWYYVTKYIKVLLNMLKKRNHVSAFHEIYALEPCVCNRLNSKIWIC